MLSAVLAVAVFLYSATSVSEIWILPSMWAVLIFLLATEPRFIEQAFENKFVETVGLWSYSTYLVHYFVRDWIKFLLVRDGIPRVILILCYVGAIAVASGLLYRFIELPGRRSGRRLVDRFATRLSGARETGSG